MLRLYRGTSKQVQYELFRLAAAQTRTILLYSSDDLPFDWEAVREIIAELRRFQGEHRWREIIDRHKAVMACACPEFGLELNAADQAEYQLIRARVTTHSNRNHYVVRRAAALLAELSRGQDFSLFIPSLERLDFLSFTVLKALYTHHLADAPLCHLGLHALAEPVTCSRAIQWSWHPSSLDSEILGMQLIEGTEIITLDTPDCLVEVGAPPQLPDADGLLGELPERTIYERLKLPHPLNPALYERACRAVEASFSRHAFRSSLKLAMLLLDRTAELGADYLPRVQALAATTAHFYHFSHESNPVFDRFLESCLRGGLSGQLDPELRLACWFRLMFTIAERMDEPARALQDLNGYLAELEQTFINPLRWTYQRSWAFFIRCYITAHTGTKDDAWRINQQAYNCLDEAEAYIETVAANQRDFWREELKLCRFNLAAHSVYLGEHLRWFDFNQYWYKVAEPLTYGQPKAVHFEVYHWVHHHRFMLNYPEALRRAEIGIADAGACCNAGMLYIFLTSAADLCDRMGLAAKAADYLARAIQVHSKYDDTFRIPSHHYLLAKYQFRAGYDPKQSLAQAVAELGEEHQSACFHVRGYLARNAARQGRVEEAEAILNALIDAAQASGERDLVVTALLQVAETCALLDEYDSATEAAAEAWAVLSENLDAGIKARHAAAALRHLSQAAVKAEQVAQLLKPFRKELIFGDTWWLLADFLKIVAAAASQNPALFKQPEQRSDLEILLTAGRQRADCDAVLDRLSDLLNDAETANASVVVGIGS